MATTTIGRAIEKLRATGILLMFYYHPAAPQAYLDMKDLRFVVSNGVFLRNLHRVAAHVMVIAVFWHMFHVFYRGGYRPPHEFNWVVGVVLLLVTLFLSYTGYLLPWDQLAFWAITVGSNIISAMPVLGKQIRFLLLGGKHRRRERSTALLCTALRHTAAGGGSANRSSLLANPERWGPHSARGR